ncbi:hypothetical protein PT223_27665, partial [Klebsiella pneumoniae]|nr:hypothetical protein [Klebsiella pneumoniae]
LLTILGVIAAVWALITPNARLRLRVCLAWWDWAIIVTSFILSNYLLTLSVDFRYSSSGYSLERTQYGKQT